MELIEPYHGVDFPEYRDRVLPELMSFEHPANMPDRFVPETYYYLWDEGHFFLRIEEEKIRRAD